MRNLLSSPAGAGLGIALISLTLRLAVVASSPWVEPVIQNESARIARSLATTGDFANPYVVETGYTAHCAPLQPAILSLFFRAFGITPASQLAKQIYNALLLSASAGLLPLLALTLGLPLWSGVLGGILLALPLGHAELLTDWEAPLLQLLILGFTIRCYRSQYLAKTWRSPAFYGLAWGLSLNLNPGVVFALAVIAGKNILDGHFRKVALLLGCAALCLVPWTLRNYARFGKWIFLRSNAGLELYISTGDDAGPSYSTNAARHLANHPSSNAAAARKVKELGEVVYFGQLGAGAQRWILGHPRAYGKLVFGRFVYMAFPDDFEGRRYTLIVWVTTVLSAIGLPLALIAYRRAGLFLAAMLFALSFAYILVGQANMRYRVPSYSFSALLAGLALCHPIPSLRAATPDNRETRTES